MRRQHPQRNTTRGAIDVSLSRTRIGRERHGVRETRRWREATLGENTLGYEGKQILSHGADRRNKQLFIDYNWYWSSVFITRHAMCGD